MGGSRGEMCLSSSERTAVSERHQRRISCTSRISGGRISTAASTATEASVSILSHAAAPGGSPERYGLCLCRIGVNRRIGVIRLNNLSTQLRNEDGTLSTLNPQAVETLKTRVLEAMASGKPLLKAVEAAGISWATLWRWKTADPAFSEAIDNWRHGVGLKSVAVMEDARDNPVDYAAGMPFANWGNFTMITAKTAFPDMRDSAKIELNLGVNVAAGDWGSAVDAVYARKSDPEVIEGES